MIVQKFGGTSVGSAERMKAVAHLVNDGQKKVVVLSAVAGTTNALVGMVGALSQGNKKEMLTQLVHLQSKYEQLVAELFSSDAFREKATDILNAHWSHLQSFSQDMFTIYEERAILAQGELISTSLMQLYFDELGVACCLLPALDFMRIDQQLEPDNWYVKSNLQRLMNAESGSTLFLTQGFICRNHFGDIDNLKRGGSDYSASIIASAVGAERLEIWTDIDGMHNNDPRVVRHTRPIEKLTFDEAAELAYFGAKILHPASVQPARKAGIPVWLKNSMHPEKKGTIISGESSGSKIKAIAAKEGITAIKIKSYGMLLAFGFLRKVFEVFERYRISIDMITTSEVAVSLTIDHQGDIQELLKDLREYGEVEVDQNQCIVCIVGQFLQHEPGYASLVFDSLQNVPLRMISYGGSKNNISILVHSDDKREALEALNKGLFDL